MGLFDGCCQAVVTGSVEDNRHPEFSGIAAIDVAPAPEAEEAIAAATGIPTNPWRLFRGDHDCVCELEVGNVIQT